MEKNNYSANCPIQPNLIEIHRENISVLVETFYNCLGQKERFTSAWSQTDRWITWDLHATSKQPTLSQLKW